MSESRVTAAEAGEAGLGRIELAAIAMFEHHTAHKWLNAPNEIRAEWRQLARLALAQGGTAALSEPPETICPHCGRQPVVIGQSCNKCGGWNNLDEPLVGAVERAAPPETIIEIDEAGVVHPKGAMVKDATGRYVKSTVLRDPEPECLGVGERPVPDAPSLMTMLKVSLAELHAVLTVLDNEDRRPWLNPETGLASADDVRIARAIVEAVRAARGGCDARAEPQ